MYVCTSACCLPIRWDHTGFDELYRSTDNAEVKAEKIPDRSSSSSSSRAERREKRRKKRRRKKQKKRKRSSAKKKKKKKKAK